MALIRENKKVGEDLYLLTVEQGGEAVPGQFYMVRSWGKYPLLSRPVSIFHQDETTTTFFYRVVGEGTLLLSQSKKGDDLDLQGPYGKGFPMVAGKKLALVGGGIGTAPLYWTAMALAEQDPANEVTLYLGFETPNEVLSLFQELGVEVRVQIGGRITEILADDAYDAVYTCGPEIMMKKVYERYKDVCPAIYVSMEKHMACGVGACLGCTCETKEGNKRTCKDGPVFPGGDVFYE